MSGKDQVVAVRVSPETHARLTALAAEDRRSISQIVRFMIERALESGEREGKSAAKRSRA